MNAGKPLNPAIRGGDITLLAICFAILALLGSSQAQGGGACVVAKRYGDSLAIEWIASPEESAAGALAKAKRKLLDQGFRSKGQDVHAQANTELRHAYMVIVKAQYVTIVGRSRTSYGCGYSTGSVGAAERAAVNDLRNYSWGWNSEFGYEVIKRLRY